MSKHTRQPNMVHRIPAVDEFATHLKDLEKAIKTVDVKKLFRN